MAVRAAGSAVRAARGAITALRLRRRAATLLAVLLAAFCAWHAVFGHNGITAYAAKRGEDTALRGKIDQLTEQNARLADHVTHLESDPDTIEMEARQRLHYARPGEVIYTMPQRGR